MDLGLTSLPAQLARILVVGLVVAYWFGYGATRWLIPRDWLPYRWLLMPAVGLTLFAVIAQPLALLGVNSPTLIWILFPFAFLVNVLAFWRAPRIEEKTFRREQIAPLLSALIALALGVLPLFAYGYITIIGYNADGTTYVSQAEFAKQFGLATGTISNIPSPFAKTDVFVIQTGIGAVASLWHSVVSQLLQRDSFYSYAPLLALWYGLSFLSAFVCYRLAFQFHFWTSLGALAALGLNSTRLLIPLDNFSPHTFLLVLLPLEWMASQHYIETGTRRTLLLAALTLAAQIMIYPEGTPFYVLPILVYLVLSVGRNRFTARLAVLRWLQIGIVSLLVAPTAYWQLSAVFIPQVATVAQALGGTIPTFISLAEGLGINALRIVEHPFMESWDTGVRAFWDVVAWFAVLIMFVLFGVGVVYSVKTQRNFLAASAIAFAAFLAWMYFVQNYPYGFFKTFATVVLVFNAVIAFGIQIWIEKARGWNIAAPLRWAPLVVVGFLVLLLSTSMIWFETTIAQRPPVVTRKLIQLTHSPDLLPPNAPIFLSLTRNPNPYVFWAAYLFRDHPLYGQGRVAYSDMHNARAGVVYDYALLNRKDDPLEFGYAPDTRVWQDRWLVLYRKP